MRAQLTHDDGVFQQWKLRKIRVKTLKRDHDRASWTSMNVESRLEEIADLRKTARGASSPAKPALHIPELDLVSHNTNRFDHDNGADRIAASKTKDSWLAVVYGSLTHCQ